MSKVSNFAMKPDCRVEGCGRPQSPKAAKGLCAMHYRRLREKGHVGGAAPIVDRSLSVEGRFWSKVDKTGAPYFGLGSCWEWTAQRTPNGYGRFWPGSAGVLAHRWAYEALVGLIPEGLQLDHLCRNRGCCNPAHLEPVTNAENQRRGFGPPGLHARATHCKRGHEFTEENTYRRPSRSHVRECLTCLRDRQRVAQQRRRRA
jgi:hypothetical protein